MNVENYLQKKTAYNKEYMPEYRKMRREMLLSQHRCTKCGKKDEYTASGRHNCRDCCEKAAAYRQGKRCEKIPAKTESELASHIREYRRNYQRDLRSWRKTHHLCTQCGQQDALTLNGKYLCQSCWEKNRGHPYIPKCVTQIESDGLLVEPKMAQDERKDRADKGFCWLCGAPVKKGTTIWGGNPYRICDRHYDLLTKASQKGRRKYCEQHLGKTWGQDTYDWINVGKADKIKGADGEVR